MRKYIHTITSCLLLISFFALSTQEMDARSKKRKSKKDKVESVEVKKTPYEKFMEDVKMSRKEGFVTIMKKGEDFYLEIPQHLIGRKIISSTRIEESTDPSVSAGSELSENQVLVIGRTDSLILLKRPAPVSKIKDAHIAAALGEREPIIYSFPIKYRNADSTAFVVKANALFNLSDKKILNLKGVSYGDSAIGEFSVKSDRTLFREIASFGESVGIRKDVTFELGIAVPGFGFIASDKPVSTLSLLMTISLLPDEAFAGRISDSRIGTYHKEVTVFEADKEIDSESWAHRWKVVPSDPAAYFAGKGSEVAEPITVYVDDKMGPAWYKAVEEGILAWKPAFEKIGLRNAIVVKPFSSSENCLSASPLYSCVSFAPGEGTSIVASRLSDESTGQIMSCRLTIPGNYISGVHRRAVYSIADVDPRYQRVDLQEDAVCEVLRADIIKLFGFCLGLRSNMAGTAAYAPEQLRDPEFTSEHGFTASVTDDVLFNYLARPGDKERGVKTIVDQIGAYDSYAIEWLYRPFEKNEKEQLDSLIASKKGQPEYFYAGRQRMFFDSRAIATDLGNDIFEAYDAGISHVKFVAEHAHEWMQCENVDDSYMELFYDWLWLRFNSLTYTLSSHVGALNTNDHRSGLPRMETLPEDVQKKALRTALRGYINSGWIGENKTLLHMSGAYKNADRMTMTSLLQISGLPRKLPMIAMAEKELGSDYTAREFMKDLQNEILADARKGRLHKNGYDIGVAKYLTWMISYSPVMKQNYKDFMSKTGRKNALAEEDSFRLQLSGIPSKYTVDLEAICYESLGEAVKVLEQGRRACRNAYDKKRYDFLISFAEAALGR